MGRPDRSRSSQQLTLPGLLGGLRQSLSGICIDSFIFLFARCQFGKATSHSPLKSYILSLMRHGATLTPPLTLRAGWMTCWEPSGVRLHARCAGLVGGCLVCTDNHAAATAAFPRFLELCRRLGLTLSPGKGFPPAQRGELTGVCLRTGPAFRVIAANPTDRAL
jgi:hypothetical protein